jgi:endogenous inhibitor of DNA gyrase (YacG/DUF329 family)
MTMKGPTCPICGRRLEGPRSEWPKFPFCSDKCKTIDLGRWLSERYTVPKQEQEPEEGADEESP